VKFVKLPEGVSASKIRIYPVEWQNQSSLRCEIHLGHESAAGGGKGNSLEECVSLVRSSISEVRRGIEERQQAKTKEDEAKHAEVSALKNKAEQERDVLEARLKEALARLEELESNRPQLEERASKAENEALTKEVELERLRAQLEQLEGDLVAGTEEKGSAVNELNSLRAELDELRTGNEDLTQQLQVMTEERDFARAKEEEMFDLIGMKDEDLMDTNNGYVYLTERLQEKEEEMEKLMEQIEMLQQGNERLDERARETSEEALQLRQELREAKSRLAEEERMHKATQELNRSLFKDGKTPTPGSRPTTASGGPARLTTGSTQASEHHRTPAPPVAEAEAPAGYEDDFDDEDA